MNCIFKLVNGLQVCENCGFQIKSNNKVFRECKKPSNKPTFIQKLQNLNRTGEEWTAQGNPVTSTVDIDTRLEICKTCENFDANSTSCKLCGCNMNLKTRLQSAHCPINKW